MLYEGRTWSTIGVWARQRNASKCTVRRSILTDGVVLGQTIHRDGFSGREIRHVPEAGIDVLIVPRYGKNWLYLPDDSATGAMSNGGGTET